MSIQVIERLEGKSLNEVLSLYETTRVAWNRTFRQLGEGVARGANRWSVEDPLARKLLVQSRLQANLVNMHFQKKVELIYGK